jgi:hypothetical protein
MGYDAPAHIAGEIYIRPVITGILVPSNQFDSPICKLCLPSDPVAPVWHPILLCLKFILCKSASNTATTIPFIAGTQPKTLLANKRDVGFDGQTQQSTRAMKLPTH